MADLSNAVAGLKLDDPGEVLDRYDVFIIPPSKPALCSLKIADILRSNNSFSFVKRPAIVGGFSNDERGRYIQGNGHLLYLHHPGPRCFLDLTLNADLTTVKEAFTDVTLEPVLSWILDHKDDFVKNGIFSLNADFLSTNEFLRSCMAFRYGTVGFQKGFVVLACRFRGTVFVSLKYQLESLREQEDKESQMCGRHGQKFKHFLFSHSPSVPPNPREPFVEGRGYRLVMRSTFGGLNLMYDSTVHGIDSEDAIPEGELPSLDQLVEVRTVYENLNWRQEQNFKKYKTRDWFLKSILAGTQKIVCGIRSRRDKGIVREIKDFRVAQLPSLCAGSWSPKESMQSLQTILNFIKRQFHLDDPKKVLAFSFRPEANVDVYDVSDIKQILPNWFLEKVVRLEREFRDCETPDSGVALDEGSSKE